MAKPVTRFRRGVYAFIEDLLVFNKIIKEETPPAEREKLIWALTDQIIKDVGEFTFVRVLEEINRTVELINHHHHTKH